MILGFASSGTVQSDYVEIVAAAVSRVLSLEWRILPGIAPPPAALDRARGQYHAGMFLEAIAGLHSESLRVIAVTSCDLFLPIFTHVYGEALVSGRAAVVSIHRIGRGPGEADRGAFPPVERTEKVTLHEILHTFGLTHCRRIECAMRPVVSLPDLDTIPLSLCPSCTHLWEQAWKDLAGPKVS